MTGVTSEHSPSCGAARATSVASSAIHSAMRRGRNKVSRGCAGYLRRSEIPIGISQWFISPDPKERGRPGRSSPRRHRRQAIESDFTRRRIFTDFPSASQSTVSHFPILNSPRRRSAVASAARQLETSQPEMGQVTTFEMLTAMAFTTFAERRCRLAVIEVGLGGRYDSTNVVDPIVSVITRIDLEHIAVLGPTYADIAWQKAGILRRGVPSVSSPQVPVAEETIRRVAREVGSPLQVGGRDWTWSGTWRSFEAKGPWGNLSRLSLGIPGPHQIENACTALAALHIVAAAGIHLPEAAIRSGLAAARWPGRFERHIIDGRDVVFDGAHTPAAAVALVEAWREGVAAIPATVVLGMGADKDARAFLESLRPLISRLIVTRADSPRAADPDVIAQAAAALGIPHEVRPSVAAAVEAARTRDTAPILITGSLFVVGEGREAIGLAKPDLDWLALNRTGRPNNDS